MSRGRKLCSSNTIAARSGWLALRRDPASPARAAVRSSTNFFKDTINLGHPLYYSLSFFSLLGRRLRDCSKVDFDLRAHTRELWWRTLGDRRGGATNPAFWRRVCLGGRRYDAIISFLSSSQFRRFISSSPSPAGWEPRLWVSVPRHARDLGRLRSTGASGCDLLSTTKRSALEDVRAMSGTRDRHRPVGNGCFAYMVRRVVRPRRASRRR